MARRSGTGGGDGGRGAGEAAAIGLTGLAGTGASGAGAIGVGAELFIFLTSSSDILTKDPSAFLTKIVGVVAIYLISLPNHDAADDK